MNNKMAKPPDGIAGPVRKTSGLEDIPENEKAALCLHPEHNPPMHLYIPPGKRYRHVCPGCGSERLIYGSPVLTS